MTDSEMMVLRREMDRDMRERLLHLETRQDELERRIMSELEEDRAVLRTMTVNIQRLLDRQHDQGPALDALQTVVHAGLAMRWIIIAVVATLAAVGTTATALEVMQRWFYR